MKRIFRVMRVSGNKKIVIAVDAEAMIEITQYLGQSERHKGKFIDIAKVNLGGLSNRDLFKQEKINNVIRNVWAMRFFPGQENDRIYCQEKSEGDVKIYILGILHLHKTSNKNSEREIRVITKLSGYEYGIEPQQKGKFYKS